MCLVWQRTTKQGVIVLARGSWKVSLRAVSASPPAREGGGSQSIAGKRRWVEGAACPGIRIGGYTTLKEAARLHAYPGVFTSKAGML